MRPTGALLPQSHEGQASTHLTHSPGPLLYCTMHNHLQCQLDKVQSAAARTHNQLLLDACLLGAQVAVHRRQCTHTLNPTAVL